MKLRASKIRTVLAYIIYSVLLIGCFLYFFFPSDAIRGYLLASVNGGNSGVVLNVKELRLRLPYDIMVTEPVLTLKRAPGERLFAGERLRIRPDLLSFLTGTSGYYFKADAYGGNLKGKIRIKDGTTGFPYSVSVELADLYVDEYGSLPFPIRGSATGVMSGTVTYEGSCRKNTDICGKADLVISDGSLELPGSFFNLSTIEFDEMVIKAVLKRQEVELTRVNMTGPQIQITLSGKMKPAGELMNSGLDLQGSIALRQGLFSSPENDVEGTEAVGEPMSLPVVIQGTISAPKVSFQ